MRGRTVVAGDLDEGERGVTSPSRVTGADTGRPGVSSASPRITQPRRSKRTQLDHRAALLSADDNGDAREVDGSRVVGQELGERPGGESSRLNRVRMPSSSKREGDGQLVGPDGLRAVP